MSTRGIMLLLLLAACGGPGGSAKPKAMPKTTWAAPPARLDIVDLGPDGDAVELTPVAGKVTVFDFWAPWCGPCKIMDRELHSLLLRYPGRIAVRRLNVVDWDSAASQRYLGAQNQVLPWIEVYGADGRHLLSEGGPPPKLIRDIEEALTAGTP